MKASGICSSLLQQRLISSPFVDHSPFITFSGTIDLLVQFNHQYKQHTLSIALWTWSKLLRSDQFLAGIQSDLWSTSVQVKKESLVSASSFGKENTFIF